MTHGGRILTTGAALAGVTLLVTVVAAAHAPQTVAGRWNMTVAAGAHGDVPGTLVLTEDGSKVTGTLSAHGRVHEVEGTFADGQLTLTADHGPNGQRVQLTGRLQQDGTMAGYLSTPDGDLKWTASRVVDGK